MIFVTVGMHYQSFDRLIRRMDEIAAKIDEEVIMQIGSTSYEPKNAKNFRFLDADEKIQELYKEARVVVSHCGAGTILSVSQFNKPLVLVPRLQEFGEHIDNQQLELAEALAERKGIEVVYDVEALEHALNEVQLPEYDRGKDRERLINFLRDYLSVGK
jgi:beta-1,4-N-acetylglucosaminyltransferase